MDEALTYLELNMPQSRDAEDSSEEEKWDRERLDTDHRSPDEQFRRLMQQKRSKSHRNPESRDNYHSHN